MDRTSVTWTGYWSALVTPFDEHSAVDLSALGAVVDWTITNGADGLLVNGSTGEYSTQTLDERRAVVEAAVASAAGRAPVMVNVTASRVDDAIELAEHAEASGAAGVLLSAPGLVRPTADELIHYFERVLGATSLPACVYNFPQESGHGISLDELGRLIEINTVVAVKQASSDLRDTLQAIERFGDRIRVFGHLLSPLGTVLLPNGMGDGYIGSAMLFGAAQPGFFRLVSEGRIAEARAEAERIEAGLAALLGPRPDGYNWAFGGMQPTIKAAMRLQGIPGGYPREPKLPLAPDRLAALEEALREHRLLDI